MWVISASLLTLVVSVVVGQDQVDNCECTLFFLCNGTVVSNAKCDMYQEVCCISAPPPNIDTDGVTEAVTEVVTEAVTEAVTVPSTTTEESTSPPPSSKLVSAAGTCGKRGEHHVDPAVTWKIIGDDVGTSFGEFPWMVAVLKSDATGKTEFLCGGSIIYPNIILTAAHSVRDYSERDLTVKAGVWDTVDPKEVSKHQDRAVSRIVVHPEFEGKRTIANDVAILVLSESLVITENVATVCLPSSETQLNTSACVATGWGTDNFGKNTTSTVLKKVDLPLIDYNFCQDQLRQIKILGGSKFNLHNSFICAGGAKTDTCRGDGGGPLMCPSLDESKHYTQVGVTSWGVDCGKGPPGVYASVQAASAWIENIVREYPSISERGIKDNE